jgi:rhamnosyltransferase
MPSQSSSPHTAPVVPSRENICAIVVTYFPDAQFIARLDRIHQQVARIIVVDNTGNPGSGIFLEVANRSGIEVIRNGQNLGIGAALNQGIDRAKQLGYPWVITFDQDSWVHSELVKTLIEIYRQQLRPERVGIIGCNFEEENTHTPLMKFSSGGPIFREIEAVITSGSLLSFATFSKVGPFRADFFIDYIDHEYCLRLLQSGYKVIISVAPLMVHALGAGSQFSLDSGLGRMAIVLTNRSPLRRYYMTRNGLIVAGQYFAVAPKWVLKSVVSLLIFAPLKIPWEGAHPGQKLYATFYGLCDALRTKTGKASGKWLDA